MWGYIYITTCLMHFRGYALHSNIWMLIIRGSYWTFYLSLYLSFYVWLYPKHSLWNTCIHSHHCLLVKIPVWTDQTVYTTIVGIKYHCGWCYDPFPKENMLVLSLNQDSHVHNWHYTYTSVCLYAATPKTCFSILVRRLQAFVSHCWTHWSCALHTISLQFPTLFKTQLWYTFGLRNVVIKQWIWLDVFH